MNVIRLQEHEHPARPDHDVRRQSVLDSRDQVLGVVANLFVDEDERHVRFIDVVPENWLGRPRERHHHLVPIEALIPRAEAIRRDSYAEVELQVDKETVESSPTLPPSLDAPILSYKKQSVSTTKPLCDRDLFKKLAPKDPLHRTRAMRRTS